MGSLEDLHTASWNKKNTKTSFAQGTAAGENPHPVNSPITKNPSTTEPVPRADVPVAYGQDAPCCFIPAAIYGRFALSPTYLSLWMAYLLAALGALSASLVVCFYIWSREQGNAVFRRYAVNPP